MKRGNLPFRICSVLTSIALLVCCSMKPEPGVSAELARDRGASLSDIRYCLNFDLTSDVGMVSAYDTIVFRSAVKQDVILDFKAPVESVRNIEVNGKAISPNLINEHLIIPRRYVNKGDNLIAIDFLAGEQSLNRREEFLYTLLVPDRARTLFPCFDQPDLKAVFKLDLTIPESWTAVSNTAVCREESGRSCTTFHFSQTKPLSTYLFSFVAGRFDRIVRSRGGRTISMYHRETDTARIAQSEEVFELVFDSLEWMEEYTGIPYPFDKYDFIVLPDFQYGGMEHAGATLYNDKRIFTGPRPTTDELLERASLIAHETSHMWFGDYVTMRWFDDVWTKEVFANWFAAQIVRPAFPSVNHTLSDLKNYYAPAYSEDRTRGSNAIWRPLDNLQDAGLIYCNIIYDKAPVVMDKLAEMTGPEKFRNGMREYLRRFGYSNATWDELVEILDRYSEADLERWSDTWIKEPGMPEYSPEDPVGEALKWQQKLCHRIEEGKYWIPNIDGKGYGWFRPDAASMEYIMEHWERYGETERMSLLMTLHENSWRGTLDRKKFIEWCGEQARMESSPLIISSLISYAAGETLRCEEERTGFAAALRGLASDRSADHEFRLMAFRQLTKSACTPEQWDELFSVWKQMCPYPGLELDESDYTALACQLMIRFPDVASEIASIQKGRIQNPDRLETFKILCKAASPDRTERKALFDSFLKSPENRRPESRVLSALSLLCHRSRREEAGGYIVPSLDALTDIQRSGDIFFPAEWCRTLLRNQQNANARNIVNAWLEAHPDTNPLLVTKILQSETSPD